MRKSEQAVNMVLVGSAYQVVSDYDMMLMKARGQVVFQKARTEKGLHGYFYKKVS